MSGPMPLTEAARTAEPVAAVLRLPGGRGGPAVAAADGADPVDLLAAELADRTGPAVHPYEVAALLESLGMTESRIRREYGHRDLFQLAEDLYRRVPRSHPAPPPAPDPWRPDTLRCALRGLLFALPGLGYLLAPGPLADRGTLRGLVLAALLSWAWSQALSHRAHLRLATGRPAARRTLALGAPAGAALATGAGAASAPSAEGAAFLAGQSLYLAAAGVLLVLGGERVLACALLPLAAGAAALPFGVLPPWAGPSLCLAAVLLSAAAAVRALLPLRGQERPSGPAPAWHRSLPYGLFGIAAGVLALTAGRREPLAVVVLTLSMGPAEWLLFRFRGLAVSALRASRTPAAFALRAARALALCLGCYLLPVAAGGLLAGSAPAPLTTLAAVLFTALLLQAFGTAWPAALGCAAAALTAALPPALGLLAPAPAQLLGCTAAGTVLLALAAARTARPTAHA
ncbi:hypothetical protein ABZ929_24700 [Streptomyces physcomitrii]|uniref:hypothetical protein n=1 Tax=Streptomyces physcomitrii TaxID=2724184 RepID=UPI00344666F8